MLKQYLHKNKLFIIGALLGVLLGYSYWKLNQTNREIEVGTCLFKTSAIDSIIWGAVLCSLTLSLFQKKD